MSYILDQLEAVGERERDLAGQLALGALAEVKDAARYGRGIETREDLEQRLGRVIDSLRLHIGARTARPKPKVRP